MKKSAKSHSKKTEQRRAHMIIAGVIIAAAALVVVELSPFGGNVRFYAKWIECGQKPVAGGGELALGSTLLSYKEPESFQLVRFLQPDYFCTPLEAELAGYSASPTRYEFPNIDAESR